MEYLEHLKKDPILATIITEPLPALKLRKNIPLRLMAAIMSQQLSTKVAAVIYKRFLEIFNGKEPTPKQVQALPFDTLRAIGLSNAKTMYVQNVAAFCIDNKITDKKLQAMSDEDIIALLTQIKGVGKWTVEMLLMFSLGREDVFSIDDYGLLSAVVKLYGLSMDDKKLLRQQVLDISKNWSPYRTYACLYLWKWRDN
jgi:DNA-3-methyladenine glycosylase II